MSERLLEGWLDSASERSYQAPFCQMLAGQGYTVVHSTRHSPIEFGKDILAIDSTGTPCAFQLKGNPGTKLTKNEFQRIQGQLVELVTQPIIFPDSRVTTKNHKTYLVTNGEAEEEVHRAIDDLNRGFKRQNAIGAPITLITRGTLLSWAIDLGSSLWPSEIEDIDNLLNLLVWEGDDNFPEEGLHKLLIPLLRISPNDARISAADLKRRITSAALITSVSLRNFSRQDNHFAQTKAWIIFIAYAIAACEKHQHSFKRNAQKAVEIAEDTIFDSLADLCEELVERNKLIPGDAIPDNLLIQGYGLTDNVAYRGRYDLIVALMSLYWFWCREREWPNKEHEEFVESFLPRDFQNHHLWGEGAIPQFIIYLWYLRASEPSPRPDYLLKSFLENIISVGTNSDGTGLPSPYYSYEDFLRHELQELLGLKEDPYRGDSFLFRSFFAQGLLHLLVRTNLKNGCKELWPNFSKLGLSHFQPDEDWQFCLWRSEDGQEIMVQPPLTKTWEDLVDEARDVSCEGVPVALKNKFLLMLWTIIFPYRGTPSVVRFLGKEFNDSWFIAPPLA